MSKDLSDEVLKIAADMQAHCADLAAAEIWACMQACEGHPEWRFGDVSGTPLTERLIAMGRAKGVVA